MIARLAELARRLPWAFGINIFPSAGANPATQGATERALAFDKLFVTNGWGSTESRSGAGSEIKMTRIYAERLRRFLEQSGADSLIDAPCGDLNWILPVVDGLRYIGGDISTALVAELRRTHPAVDTRPFDICEDPFPEASLWHCRDCLFHLPFADIDRALRNFARSSIPVALITTHKTRLVHRNVDVPVGGWRVLDLEKPPISLPRPRRYLRDYRFGYDFPRYVGVWTREDISQAIEPG